MWRKTILTAVLLLVLIPVESRSQYSGEITLDPVIGQVGPGKIGIGQIVLPLRAAYTGPGGTFACGSNSFMLYSPSLNPGSILAIKGERLESWTSILLTYQGERVRSSSDVDWFQQPIPTPPFDISTPGQVAGIWFAGVPSGSLLGMPTGFSEIVWNIKFVTSAADVGNVICLDQATPAIQAWEWASGSNSWIPVFNNGAGPACFTIEAVGLTPVSDPPGTPVEVEVDETLTVTFDDVTSGGVTTVTTQTAGPAPPDGYQVVPGQGQPVYYDIETTATYSGQIEVCFKYTESQVAGQESNLKLLHWTGTPPASSDITIYPVDVDNNIICGVTTSLSLFAMAEPVCCVDRVGDANGLGGDEPTIGDASVMIDAKFITGTCVGILECFTEADINQSGGIDPDCDDVTISDISILIDYLFITGPSLGLAECL